MKCSFCGSEVPDRVKFCTSCGAPIEKQSPVTPPVEVPPITPPPADPVPPRPTAVPPQVVIPAENRPLSPWAYFGLQLLFSIPLVGFICLIVFSLDNGNINRRNFARSYWCSLLVSVIILIVLIVLLLATGVGAALVSELDALSL